jgi:quinol monooxygenase YgiN
MTYVIAAQWRARDGEADKIARLLPELVRECKAEPGVIEFIAHRSPDDPNEFFLYEQYRDEAAFKTHQATPHFKRLVLEGAVPLLEKRIRMPLRILA